MCAIARQNDPASLFCHSGSERAVFGFKGKISRCF